jgi:hypothetical protein
MSRFGETARPKRYAQGLRRNMSEKEPINVGKMEEELAGMRKEIDEYGRPKNLSTKKEEEKVYYTEEDVIDSLKEKRKELNDRYRKEGERLKNNPMVKKAEMIAGEHGTKIRKFKREENAAKRAYENVKVIMDTKRKEEEKENQKEQNFYNISKN